MIAAESLQSQLLDLERLAREIGEAPVQQGIQDLSEQLTQGQLRLAVIGPTGAGKSSLINALVGRLLLPEGQLGTTGRAVAVTTGGRGAAAREGIRADGFRAPLTEAQFQNACLGAGRWAEVSASVPPAEPLPIPVTLVDTPGVDPAADTVPAGVLNEITKSDGLILVCDYRSDLPEAWLKRLSTEMGAKAVLRLINFCTSPQADERTAALEQRLMQIFGPSAQTLRVMDRDTAGFPAGPICSALQALLTTDHRARLAQKTLVWEAMKLWQRLELALAVLETETAALREDAAAAEGRIRQVEALRDQALASVNTWRKRVEEQLVTQIAGRVVQTELDARCASLDLAIGRLGAELRTALRGFLDKAAAVVPFAAPAPGAAESARWWVRDPFADSTPPGKKYLVKLPRDPASLKADLLHRYRTAAEDLSEQLRELVGRHFDGLISAQHQKRHELASTAHESAARLNSIRTRLQATGEWLRRIGPPGI